MLPKNIGAHYIRVVIWLEKLRSPDSIFASGLLRNSSHLYSIPVVNIDINVDHSRMILQQLQDGDHDVVDVAKAAGLKLLGVVQPTRPVEGDVALA